MSIKVDRNASQLERMTSVKPKIEIKATLRNASSTVFEQGYEETYISNNSNECVHTSAISVNHNELLSSIPMVVCYYLYKEYQAFS